MNKIRFFGLFLTLFLLAFLSLASMVNTAPLAQATATLTVTPTLSRARATAMALEAQAGHSDGILLLGLLIFVFIATPILINYRGTRSNK